MNGKRLTISVAMATYNGSKYLLEQLSSIEAQSVLPDEVIICDDRSSDNTLQVIREYMSKSKLTIKLTQNDHNLGFSKNFEKAISLCTKDIVFLCDQDDVWTSDKVEMFLKEFENNQNLVYAFSDAFVVNENLEIMHDSIWKYSGIDWISHDRQSFFNYVQTRNFPLGFSAAVKRDFVQQIFPFLSHHDGWIAICAALFGDVKAIDHKLVYYRRHSSATSAFAKSQTGFLLTFGRLKRLFTIGYQEYFTWPKAEYVTFKQITDYAEENQAIDYHSILEHLEYLTAMDQAESQNIYRRISTLKSLYQSGKYGKYRGNRNTFILDCLYMIVNAFTHK